MAPKLKEFPQFPELPKELRDRIWKLALRGTPDRRRMVVIYQDRVLPCKYLISPLLAANNESRGHALHFYNVKLPVYRIDQLDPARVEHLEDMDTYLEEALPESRYGRLPLDQWFIDAHHRDFMSRELKTIVSEDLIPLADDNDSQKGFLYLSPEHDMFIDGFDAGLHFCIDAKIEILEQRRTRADLKWRHITSELPAEACARVSRLICVTEPAPTQTPWEEDRWPNMYRSLEVARAAKVYSKEKAKSFWCETVYSDLQVRGRLNIDDDDEQRRFMYDITNITTKFTYKIEWFHRWNASNGVFYATNEELRRVVNAARAARAAAAAEPSA